MKFFLKKTWQKNDNSFGFAITINGVVHRDDHYIHIEFFVLRNIQINFFTENDIFGKTVLHFLKQKA
jgi:hypothetical protein